MTNLLNYVHTKFLFNFTGKLDQDVVFGKNLANVATLFRISDDGNLFLLHY